MQRTLRELCMLQQSPGYHGARAAKLLRMALSFCGKTGGHGEPARGCDAADHR